LCEVISMMKGLFLDFDGTLCSSLDAMEKAYLTFMASVGLHGTTQEFSALNGPPLTDIILHLRAAHNLTDPTDELLARYRVLVDQAHAAAIPAPGARDLLNAGMERGWTIAVVTSAASASVQEWLRRHMLFDRVAVVIGGDSVRRGKPSAEPYLAALKATGCSARRSLAVEDSEQGVLSAMAAEIPTWMLSARAPASIGGALFQGCIPNLQTMASKLRLAD